MNTVKLDNNGKCQMVAHRGLSGIEKENTNSAFVAAGNRSYYGIETDVYRTADGHFVLMHDADAYRVSGDRINIEESTYDTVRSIVLYDRDGKKGRNDLKVPDLKEYIEICKKYEKIAVLELKSDFTVEELEKICAVFKELDYFDNVLFISFIYDNLVKVRSRYPDKPVQYLTGKFGDDLIDRLKVYSFDLDIEYRALNEENIKLCHDNGIKVNCWTVNDSETAQKLIGWGVDFITTNILE